MSNLAVPGSPGFINGAGANSAYASESPVGLHASRAPSGFDWQG